MKIYNYKSQFGRTVSITLMKGTYASNGNLAVKAFEVENGKLVEPYANITVNTEAMTEGCAAIDTNNLGKDIVAFLEKEEIAIPLSMNVRSGYCTYPIMCFLPDALETMGNL